MAAFVVAFVLSIGLMSLPDSGNSPGVPGRSLGILFLLVLLGGLNLVTGLPMLLSKRLRKTGAVLTAFGAGCVSGPLGFLVSIFM